jgi:hypothetical protein
VLFAFPQVDGAMVVYVKGLVESGRFHACPLSTSTCARRLVETYRVEA